jgi:type I restriction enzyme R subunit
LPEKRFLEKRGHIQDEKVELSRIIEILNKRFGREFKPGDQLFFDSVKSNAISDPALRQAPMVNSMENFGYAFLVRRIEGPLHQPHGSKRGHYSAVLGRRGVWKTIGQRLLKEVYEQIRGEGCYSPCIWLDARNVQWYSDKTQLISATDSGI